MQMIVQFNDSNLSVGPSLAMLFVPDAQWLDRARQVHSAVQSLALEHAALRADPVGVFRHDVWELASWSPGMLAATAPAETSSVGDLAQRCVVPSGQHVYDPVMLVRPGGVSFEAQVRLERSAETVYSAGIELQQVQSALEAGVQTVVVLSDDCVVTADIVDLLDRWGVAWEPEDMGTRVEIFGPAGACDLDDEMLRERARPRGGA